MGTGQTISRLALGCLIKLDELYCKDLTVIAHESKRITTTICCITQQ